MLFEPFKFFAAWAAAFVAAGSAIGLRFVYYYLQGHGSGKIQSLILAAILIIVGFNVFLIGILSANLATNRKLSEELLYRVRKLETLPERQTSVSTRAGNGK